MPTLEGICKAGAGTAFLGLTFRRANVAGESKTVMVKVPRVVWLDVGLNLDCILKGHDWGWTCGKGRHGYAHYPHKACAREGWLWGTCKRCGKHKTPTDEDIDLMCADCYEDAERIGLGEKLMTPGKEQGTNGESQEAQNDA